MVLSVGQFIYRKGFDVLIKAAGKIEKNVGIYIVGGEATEEYTMLKEELGLENVHFVGFKRKEELADYYKAADLFVLPTREDIWGLVINEAMAYGLPVISTDRCVAALELIKDGGNGFVVEAGSVERLAERMNEVLKNDDACRKMGVRSSEQIKSYTIEKMVDKHLKILENKE